MLITLDSVNQVLVFIQATITFKVVLLVLGKCTINPTLWTLRSSIQRNEGRDQQTTQALKHLSVYRSITHETSNWRLKAATSQLLLHRKDRSRKLSIHVKIMEKLFTCLYASTNKIHVAVLTQDFHNITTKERPISKCIQAWSLCSISYKMLPLSERDIHCLREWNLIQLAEYAELTVHAIRFYPRRSRGLKTTYGEL